MPDDYPDRLTRKTERMPDGFPELPPDPIGSMKEMGIGLYELFVSLKDSGYTEDQAMKQIGYIIAAGHRDDDER